MIGDLISSTKPIGVRNPNIDTVLSGNLSIKGQVKLLGAPMLCRVRLFEKSTGRLIADTETDNLGNYAFVNLTQLAFFIVAHHPDQQYNAVIQDMVVPK